MSDDISISPFYHSAVNEITEPNKYAAHSHYLTTRWKSELGPNGYAILTSLRDRCFYNRKTGEVRNSIQVTMEEIGEECGISERTVRRELDSNLALKKFVRGQREYSPDDRRGGFRNGPKSFQVSMDDPVHPRDEEKLLEIVKRKAEEADKGSESALERARRIAASNQPELTSGQNDRTQNLQADNLSQSPVNLSERCDKLTDTPGQIDRTLKSPDSLLLKKTLKDASGGSDFFASLFQEPEKTGPPAWADLTPQQQEPFRAQARHELLPYALEAGEKAWARMGPRQEEVRAKNLYEASLQ